MPKPSWDGGLRIPRPSDSEWDGIGDSPGSGPPHLHRLESNDTLVCLEAEAEGAGRRRCAASLPNHCIPPAVFHTLRFVNVELLLP